jgi:hypothetical protein
MDSVSVSIADRWYETLVGIVPGIIGAIIVLIIGWIVGRLLGKAVRIVFDKISEQSSVRETQFAASIKQRGITIGYLGDIAVRLVVYLIAILAAVDILNLQHLSLLMSTIIGYIPHIVAFIVIIIVGFILVDFFIDMLGKFYQSGNIELISPVLLLLRVFLYFVVVMLGLSQLMLDLTIIYTFITPIAWGVGLGLGATIAIIAWHGLKDRSGQIIDRVLDSVSPKK